MKAKIKKALEEAAVNTFEDICFMYQVPELKDVQKNLTLEAAAEVKYRGDYTGKLLIETRGGLFSAIAANILSIDSPSSQQKRDALGEIANIICGNVVASLGRSRLGYKIESPNALKKDELLKDKRQGKFLVEIAMNFNEGRADIKFFVDGDFVAKEKKR
ncbi:MAG: chemotaxis protein CheX [Smithella sp.]